MLFHKGHVYGLDGSAFVCFDPETGERNWRADGCDSAKCLLRLPPFRVGQLSRASPRA
jgi:hypothetical protein